MTGPRAGPNRPPGTSTRRISANAIRRSGRARCGSRNELSTTSERCSSNGNDLAYGDGTHETPMASFDLHQGHERHRRSGRPVRHRRPPERRTATGTDPFVQQLFDMGLVCLGKTTLPVGTRERPREAAPCADGSPRTACCSTGRVLRLLSGVAGAVLGIGAVGAWSEWSTLHRSAMPATNSG